MGPFLRALRAKEKNPSRIVTRLADITHAFGSRTDALLDLLAVIPERAVIYVNLQDYANRIRAALKAAGLSRHTVTSYQVGHTDPADVVVFHESPIVKSYFLLDAEARVNPGGRVYHMLSDAKVDIC